MHIKISQERNRKIEDTYAIKLSIKLDNSSLQTTKGNVVQKSPLRNLVGKKNQLRENKEYFTLTIKMKPSHESHNPLEM